MNDNKWCSVLDNNNGYDVRTCSHDVAASTDDDDDGLWHLWGLAYRRQREYINIEAGTCAYLGQPRQCRVDKTSITRSPPCCRAISWCIALQAKFWVYKYSVSWQLFFSLVCYPTALGLASSRDHCLLLSLFLRSDYEYCTLFEPGNYAHFLEMSPSPFLR